MTLCVEEGKCDGVSEDNASDNFALDVDEPDVEGDDVSCTLFCIFLKLWIE